MPGTPDLVVIGNLIVDDLVFLDGTTRMGEPGGAVVYAALGAALWGPQVGIVSLAGSDYPPATLEALRAHGIDLDGVRLLPHPGLRAWLLYESLARHLVHWLGRPTHADASPGPDDVPPPWRRAAGMHLTPAPLAIQAELVRRLSASRRTSLSLDPHTPITDGNLHEWLPTLAGVDLLFVSASELEISAVAGSSVDVARDGRTAIEGLCGGRLRTVALKQGEQGGTLFAPPAPPLRWRARSAKVVDPTGAGDAFAGGFVAARLGGASVETALQQGLVSASFAMDAWGAAGLLSATAEHARERLAAWFGGHPLPHFGSGTSGTV